jgi:hypothetical protein
MREASLDAGATLRVKVRESTFYNVKVAGLEVWLKRTGAAQRDVAVRQKVRTRLGDSR